MIHQLTHIDWLMIGIATALGLLILLTKDVVKVMMGFLSILFLVGIVFLMFNSGFLFLSQLLIYIGGVTVLFIFVIMLTKRISTDQNMASPNQNLVGGSLVALVLGAVLIYAVQFTDFGGVVSTPFDEVRGLGIQMMSRYVLAFEILAVFLLISLILAVVIADKPEQGQ